MRNSFQVLPSSRLSSFHEERGRKLPALHDPPRPKFGLTDKLALELLIWASIAVVCAILCSTGGCASTSSGLSTEHSIYAFATNVVAMVEAVTPKSPPPSGPAFRA